MLLQLLIFAFWHSLHTVRNMHVLRNQHTCVLTFPLYFRLFVAPSAPRNVISYCDVLTWSTPSGLQGELTGYEVNIVNNRETKLIGPQSSSYPTTDEERRMGARIRVCVRHSLSNNLVNILAHVNEAEVFSTLRMNRVQLHKYFYCSHHKYLLHHNSLIVDASKSK